MCLCICPFLLHAALVRSVPGAGQSVAIMGVQLVEQPGTWKVVWKWCVSRVQKSIKDGSTLEKPCSVVVKVNVSQLSLIWIFF